MSKKVYTIGDVARICKVSANTARKWAITGKLKFFSIPGSRHRRVLREDLLKFIEQHYPPEIEINEEEHKTDFQKSSQKESPKKENQAWIKTLRDFSNKVRRPDETQEASES